jgi:hypothetical protein
VVHTRGFGSAGHDYSYQRTQQATYLAKEIKSALIAVLASSQRRLEETEFNIELKSSLPATTQIFDAGRWSHYAVVEVSAPGSCDMEFIIAVSLVVNSIKQVDFVTVEGIGIEPPCYLANQPNEPTPSIVQQQRCRRADPGMDADYANSVLGANGAGIVLTDIEYNWGVNHEDLHINLEYPPGFTPASPTYAPHGTSVLGCIIGGDNGFGVEGIAREATVQLYTEHSLENGYDRARAILVHSYMWAHTVLANLTLIKPLHPRGLILLFFHAGCS